MMGVAAGYLLFFACALLIRAARDLLMPFFLRASYVLGFLTDGPGLFPGISGLGTRRASEMAYESRRVDAFGWALNN